MYNCFDIAKKLLCFSIDEGYNMEPMKLLKMTYIAHGYYLAFFNKPLFINEIQAWKYGPVIPELYHVIKRFGVNNVDKEIIDLYAEKDVAENDSNFLKQIWDAYKGLDGLQLSSKTHERDTPWHITYDGSHNKTISNNSIRDYYKTMVTREGEE